ncbi:MAG: hypothetical protein ACYDH5_15385 [Acidimicrobiales bacterium]
MVAAARTWLEMLGADLGWHGALSADVILATTGPVFIDINPRLVEPENAWQAGVDLVGGVLLLGELVAAQRKTGLYAGSLEELMPRHGDPLALMRLLVASIATVVLPVTWRRFTTGSVANYALTSEGWDQILAAATAADGKITNEADPPA